MDLNGFYTLEIIEIYPNSIGSLIEAGIVNEDLFIHASTLENKGYFYNLLDKGILVLYSSVVCI